MRCGSGLNSWAFLVKSLSDKCHRTPLMISQYWFRLWLGAIRQQAITLNNVDLDLCCHIVSLDHNESGSFFDSLWPNDAIRQQGTESTLAQVMACCLTAPSHYLDKCWLIIIKVLWHSSEGNIMIRSEDPISKTRSKITFLELHSDLPGANELTIMLVMFL